MASTVIRSYCCGCRRRALDIVFQSRRRYTCLGVPEETYDGISSAFSDGEFFHQHICDRLRIDPNG